MKIVIDIPEEQFLVIRHYQDIAPNKTHSLAMSIINGTPLDAIKAEITRYTDTHCNSGYILRESVFEILEQKGVSNGNSKS